MLMDAEPTAENLLIFVRKKIDLLLPGDCEMRSLKLWETRDAYAEWSVR
jgi:hypothetical protein